VFACLSFEVFVYLLKYFKSKLDSASKKYHLKACINVFDFVFLIKVMALVYL